MNPGTVLPPPGDGRWESILRRTLDMACALLGLVLGAVPLVLGALALRLTSSAPVLYRSTRAGRHGVPFELIKLRTMKPAPAGDRITGPEDARVTPVGRVLRGLKIDEIPQLWNVLRGDMSIVGPRPEDAEIVAAHYTAEERTLLRVRPGLTSRVQIEWYPDVMYHLPPPDGVDPMTYYVDRVLHPKLELERRALQRRSIIEDLRVIMSTLLTVIRYSFGSPPPRDWPEEFR